MLEDGPPSYWSTALDEFNLSQMILSPTRVTAKSSTKIDHIYTNRPDVVGETNVPNISLSDHYPVCATRRTNNFENKRKHIEIKYRDTKTFDGNEFLTDLCRQNFECVQLSDGPNEALNFFYDIYFAALNKHSKIKTNIAAAFQGMHVSPANHSDTE